MFDGFDGRALVDQPRLKLLAAAEIGNERGNLDAEISAEKTNAVSRGRGLQRQRDFLPRVQPDSSAGYCSAKCSLHRTYSIPAVREASRLPAILVGADGR